VLGVELTFSLDFKFADILNAYSTFKEAAANKALKVLIEMK